MRRIGRDWVGRLVDCGDGGRDCGGNGCRWGEKRHRSGVLRLLGWIEGGLGGTGGGGVSGIAICKLLKDRIVRERTAAATVSIGSIDDGGSGGLLLR